MKPLLRVGLDDAAPVPLHSDPRLGNFEGFEVDLMKHISEAMQAELSYKIVLWKDILKKLESDELDVICTAVTITEARKKIISFSEPYFRCRLC